MNDLTDVYLAMYDTNVNTYTYIGSEDVDIAEDNMSLNLYIKINNEISTQITKHTRKQTKTERQTQMNE